MKQRAAEDAAPEAPPPVAASRGVAALEVVSADARPGLSALVEAQKFAILRTTFAAGTRLIARLVRQP